jgi:hypothetical protein
MLIQYLVGILKSIFLKNRIYESTRRKAIILERMEKDIVKPDTPEITLLTLILHIQDSKFPVIISLIINM